MKGIVFASTTLTDWTDCKASAPLLAAVCWCPISRWVQTSQVLTRMEVSLGSTSVFWQCQSNEQRKKSFEDIIVRTAALFKWFCKPGVIVAENISYPYLKKRKTVVTLGVIRKNLFIKLSYLWPPPSNFMELKHLWLCGVLAELGNSSFPLKAGSCDVTRF